MFPTRPRRSAGFTLLESSVVVTILVVLTSIVMIKYRSAIEAARVAKARQSLQAIANDIAAYLASNGQLPPELDDVGHGRRLDPWGNPYMYLNFAAGTGNALDFVLANGLIDPSAVGGGGGMSGQSGQSGQSGAGGGAPPPPATVEDVKRKDQFLFPLNTDYDLFSLGRNGKAWSSIAMDYSLDDVIRANDGAYFGIAKSY